MSHGGRVAAVRAASPAAAAGIEAGDVITTAEGHLLRDVIDWRWYSSEAGVTVQVERQGRSRIVRLERASGGWGIDFDEVLFDGLRTCDNECEFCFVGQLPCGLRPSLYVRDDDFRLSFLGGNFITLTNLRDADVARIIEQRLSPLFVSLHAVDPEVRRRLIRCRGEDRALEHLDALVARGIEFHIQIVLVPGVNDGGVLDETLGWLESRSGIVSVGIVPLGYTGHQDRYRTSYVRESAASVLVQIECRRARRLAQGRTRWVHAADEFYLTAGAPLPAAEEYEGYPQYENGIGLVRAFIDGWEAADDDAFSGKALPARVLRLVTGELFAPVLEALVASKGWRHFSVLSVPNRLFGGGVNVTGLLTGADLATTIGEDATCAGSHSTQYLLPDTIFGDQGRTVDDVTIDEISDRAGCEVLCVPADAGAFLSAIPDIFMEA